MLVLHLGVSDIPYHEGSNSHTETTGDVAEILEKKYHVMEHFYELHKREIAQNLLNSVKNSLDALLMGAPPPSDPFFKGAQDIETRFRHFLSMREMDALGYPGIPTQAARKGVNHGLKHPYRKGNPERPSFIDTGQYQASMRAWVTK